MNDYNSQDVAKCSHELALSSRLGMLRCPECSGNVALSKQRLHCTHCAWENTTSLDGGAYNLMARSSDDKSQIATFWGDIYKQWYAARDAELSTDLLVKQLKELDDFLCKRKHLAAIEMGGFNLAGKKILEIGSGAGGYAAFFRSRGASMTCCDITPERAFATQHKLQLLDGVFPGDGMAFVSDAENLPFHDDSFDIVFSNGVLHHTNDTVRAISEAYRVLRPGGHAVLMLYSRHSALFWTSLVPRGLLTGRIFTMPEAGWVGWFTEGRPQFAEERNPITRVYSRSEIVNLMKSFSVKSIRKSSFMLWHLGIPKIYLFREWLLRLLNVPPHQGALLTHDRAMYIETPLESAIGAYAGWAWNIVAMKPK